MEKCGGSEKKVRWRSVGGGEGRWGNGVGVWGEMGVCGERWGCGKNMRKCGGRSAKMWGSVLGCREK